MRSHKFKYDVIAIGDTSQDIFCELEKAKVMCDKSHDHCYLGVSFADKVPMTALHYTIGGNACNNAVGSARLGLKAALYTTIGNDQTGERISVELKKEKVSKEYVVLDKKRPSNVSVVLNYHTERTILIYHEHREYKMPNFSHSRWIYLTSLGRDFRKIHKPLLAYLKLHPAIKVMFNPGTHQLNAGLAELKPLIARAEVFIVNKEEAAGLLGLEDHIDIEKMMAEFRQMGCPYVIITDGPKGAYAFNGRKVFFQRPVPSKTIERTGAGDSFGTGVLAAFFYGKELPETLLWGSANAASVIEQIGPQAGLLTKPQLLARLRGSKKK